jgi:hypothetical protein
MNKPFTMFTDNAHGWLRVKHLDCAVIGLSPAQFSKYSYLDDEYYYLEEDCDAAIFISSFVTAYDAMPVIQENYTNGQSIIRTKKRFAR